MYHQGHAQAQKVARGVHRVRHLFVMKYDAVSVQNRLIHPGVHLVLGIKRVSHLYFRFLQINARAKT